MRTEHRLSIITVCFNDKHGFIQTAESVLRQSCKEFEWIVIDGGSTDGSRLEIEKLENHIDYWVSEPDKGIYNGMNKGIAVASGEYCLFLNSGDFLCSKKSIERVKDRLDGTDIIVFDIFSEKKFPFGLKPYHIMPSAITLGSLVNSGICHQAAFIKTALLKENYYDESLRITSDMNPVISMLGYHLLHLTAPVFLQKMMKETIARNRVYLKGTLTLL